MCGTCIFTTSFLNKVINKTVKNFECTDYDDNSEITITFTDDTKLIITGKECNFDTISKEHVTKYSEVTL